MCASFASQLLTSYPFNPDESSRASYANPAREMKKGGLSEDGVVRDVGWQMRTADNVRRRAEMTHLSTGSKHIVLLPASGDETVRNAGLST